MCLVQRNDQKKSVTTMDDPHRRYAAEKKRRLLEMTPAKKVTRIRVAVTYIAWCVYMRDMAREMLQPSLMSASPTLSHDIPVPQPSDHLFWPEQPSPRLYSVGRPLPKNS